jgi:mRNA interferase RelE/StbE
MSKRVEYSREAQKTLRRIDAATARSIREKLKLVARDPGALANNVKALKGDGGLKRLRVGDWRAIYTEDLLVLFVIRVAPRGAAYD